jgi:RimJ/RimL family protein N-acetyltransferase
MPAAPPPLTAPRLETDRLTLEPLRVEHADELARVLDDPELYRFTGGDPPTAAALRARFERQVNGESPDGRDRWLNWVVRERATVRALGTVQATVKPGRNANATPIADLAWVIGTGHQGNGFAKEAAACMADWLRTQGIGTLRAHIHPGHLASIRVAEALGLEPTGAIVDGERRWQSAPS